MSKVNDQVRIWAFTLCAYCIEGNSASQVFVGTSCIFAERLWPLKIENAIPRSASQTYFSRKCFVARHRTTVKQILNVTSSLTFERASQSFICYSEQLETEIVAIIQRCVIVLR